MTRLSMSADNRRRRPACVVPIVLIATACTERQPGSPYAPVDPVEPPAVVFSGAGRIASCGSTTAEATARLLDDLPGFVFTLGDNALPHGTASDFKDCYQPTWGRHRSRTYATLGNHDYDQGHAADAFGYFGGRLGPPGLGYYSVTLGTWHVIVLNDNETHMPFGPGSPQHDWLLADLAADTARCTLVLWHMPLFLSSNTPGYTVNATRRVLWNAIYPEGVDVVVNGNLHHYERMIPMQADGTRDEFGGIRQFNVGTGGESLAEPTAAIHPNSAARAAVLGVLSLTLRVNAYDWRFLPVPGSRFTDSGSGTCR